MNCPAFALKQREILNADEFIRLFPNGSHGAHQHDSPGGQFIGFPLISLWQTQRGYLLIHK
jgi:hypothetical protein